MSLVSKDALLLWAGQNTRAEMLATAFRLVASRWLGHLALILAPIAIGVRPHRTTIANPNDSGDRKGNS